MKYQTLMAALLAAPLLATPAHAADLKGPDAVAALNGKSFQCTFNGGSFSWKFHKSDPKAGHLPYTVVLNGKTIKTPIRCKRTESCARPTPMPAVGSPGTRMAA